MDGNADRLGQMGLPQTGASENEQRIERGLAGLVRDADPGVVAHLVALTLDEIVETVDRIQPWIDLQLLDARKHKRARIAGRLESVAVRGGEDHRALLLHRVNLVEKSGLGADHPSQRHLYYRKEGVLKIASEEVGRHFNSQCRLFQRNRDDCLEPDIELLRLDVLFEYAQTLVPDRNMSIQFNHCFK